MQHDPVAHMNRWRDIHRARGTSGGTARPAMTATQIRERDSGLDCHTIAMATCAAIWNDFRAWSQSERDGRDYVPETDFPF